MRTGLRQRVALGGALGTSTRLAGVLGWVVEHARRVVGHGFACSPARRGMAGFESRYDGCLMVRHVETERSSSIQKGWFATMAIHNTQLRGVK